MKRFLKTIVVIALFSFVASCCATKPATVSKEKQEQIDKDKSDFEKNVK